MCLSGEVELMTIISKFATKAIHMYLRLLCCHSRRNPTEGLLRTAVLLLHVLDACSLDCCIAREKKSREILFRVMIIACASEYARLACVEVTPTYWSGSLCQRASCKRGLARFSLHGLARLGSARFDTVLV